MPRKWDFDEDRIPHGFRLIHYDADDQIYTYRDERGALWESPPRNRYGTLRQVSGPVRDEVDHWHHDGNEEVRSLAQDIAPTPSPRRSISSLAASARAHLTRTYTPSTTVTLPESSRKFLKWWEKTERRARRATSSAMDYGAYALARGANALWRRAAAVEGDSRRTAIGPMTLPPPGNNRYPTIPTGDNNQYGGRAYQPYRFGAPTSASTPEFFDRGHRADHPARDVPPTREVEEEEEQDGAEGPARRAAP